MAVPMTQPTPSEQIDPGRAAASPSTSLATTFRSTSATMPASADGGACARIRRAQDHFRDVLASFLSQPSTGTFDALRWEGSAYLEFERDEILSVVDEVDLPLEDVNALRANHDRLVRAFNTVLWDVPGGFQLCDDVHELRHELLQQIELCERAVCPVLVTLDVRSAPLPPA